MIESVYPRLIGTSFGPERNRQTPHAVLEIEGSEIDAGALRKSGLALAGDIPLVQTIFSYVHAGTIPSITFRTDGRGVSDLGATKKIVIKGQMRDGTIGIPSQGLIVERIHGDVIISEGILKGTKVSASMWQADAREGVLRVGLKGEDAPFHLDVLVDAQLRELPSLLKRFIRNPSVVEELSRIGTIEGKARGRLVLGDSLKSTLVRIDITSLRFLPSSLSSIGIPAAWRSRRSMNLSPWPRRERGASGL